MSETPPPALLGPMEELADIFDCTPKKNTVHIIVEIPGESYVLSTIIGLANAEYSSKKEAWLI